MAKHSTINVKLTTLIFSLWLMSKLPGWATPSPEDQCECNPSKSCNVCAACCHSYIPDGTNCFDCAKQQCSSPVCLAKPLVGLASVKDAASVASRDQDDEGGFWCKAQDFQKQEVVSGLSKATARVWAQFHSSCATGGRCKRVALLIRGEAFRAGSQMTSTMCQEAEADNAIIALASVQSRVINSLREAGFDVDVFAVSYSCTPLLDHLIVALLQPWLRRSFFAADRNRNKWNQAKLLQVGLRLVMEFELEHKTSFDGILVLRFDTVILVPDVLSLTTLNSSVDAFLFPFQQDVKPVFSDVMLWIPLRALPCFLQAMHFVPKPRCFNAKGQLARIAYAGHFCYYPLLRQFQSVPAVGNITAADRIGVMTPDRFVSNTAAARRPKNPFFLMVPRSLPEVFEFLAKAKDVAAERQKGKLIWDSIRLNHTLSSWSSPAATQHP